MNDELQKQLAMMLSNLQGAATTATQWGAAQIPPLVAEKIAFGRVWETWSTLGCLIVALVGLMLLFKWAIPLQKKNEYTDPGPIFACVGSGVLAFGAFIGFLTNLYPCLLVWFAPRLYIVEWLKTIVVKS